MREKGKGKEKERKKTRKRSKMKKRKERKISQDLFGEIYYLSVNAKALGLAIKNITKWFKESLLGFQYPLNLLHL